MAKIAKTVSHTAAAIHISSLSPTQTPSWKKTLCRPRHSSFSQLNAKRTMLKKINIKTTSFRFKLYNTNTEKVWRNLFIKNDILPFAYHFHLSIYYFYSHLVINSIDNLGNFSSSFCYQFLSSFQMIRRI